MTAPPWSSAAPPQELNTPASGPNTDPTSPAEAADAERDADPEPAYVELDDPLPGPEPALSEPAPSANPAAPAPPSYAPPPAYPVVVAPEPHGRSRTAVVVAVTAVGVALAAVAGVGALVLSRDAAPPAGPASPAPSAPAATGPPPGDLTLRDDMATITLSWTDPAGGGVPFMVAGGRAGQALGVLATVDPGQTSYTVNGLNSRVDYCFTVLAVWSTDSFATSGQVCTERAGRTPPS
ncbi:hypothetical protein C1I99_31110 [Micromonospora deserti]|uniref:Fibronectin type-III domain-containing protein n=2 Tax=Micromonospora deserti TaxID=2070366 RepID=A0A2W2B761_9ACTN|nr:hypothetical protein C1I99_31110 [Micromonospora deserti]